MVLITNISPMKRLSLFVQLIVDSFFITVISRLTHDELTKVLIIE